MNIVIITSCSGAHHVLQRSSSQLEIDLFVCCYWTINPQGYCTVGNIHYVDLVIQSSKVV